MFFGLQWYWWLMIGLVLVVSIPFKVKFMKWWTGRQQEQKDQHPDPSLTFGEDVSFSFSSPQQEKLVDWLSEDASGEHYQTSEYTKLCQPLGWVLQPVFQQGLHQRNLQPTYPAWHLSLHHLGL